MRYPLYKLISDAQLVASQMASAVLNKITVDLFGEILFTALQDQDPGMEYVEDDNKKSGRRP